MAVYGDVIRSGAVYYWGSDPFDYQDKDQKGEYSFTDVDSLRNAKSFISTAIPSGSEERFIAYNKKIASECLTAIKQLGVYDDSYHGRVIRVSVGKQNIRRVEQTLYKLHETLKTAGYSEQDINLYFDHVIKCETRFDPDTIGPLIDEHDDIGGANSFSCMDGVVITPRSITARMVTAPTIYEPTGEMVIPLTPGRVVGVVPQPFYSGWHDAFFKYHPDDPLLDFPRSANGNYIELDDRAKNVELIYGRAAASYAKFITALAVPEAAKEIERSSLKDRYFDVALKQFRVMQKRVEGVRKERFNIDSQTKERLGFYKLLAEVYSTQMGFILSHWRRGSPIETICLVASEFRKIGKDSVDSIKDISRSFPRSINVRTMMSRALG